MKTIWLTETEKIKSSRLFLFKTLPNFLVPPKADEVIALSSVTHNKNNENKIEFKLYKVREGIYGLYWSSEPIENLSDDFYLVLDEIEDDKLKIYKKDNLPCKVSFGEEEILLVSSQFFEEV